MISETTNALVELRLWYTLLNFRKEAFHMHIFFSYSIQIARYVIKLMLIGLSLLKFQTLLLILAHTKLFLNI